MVARDHRRAGACALRPSSRTAASFFAQHTKPSFSVAAQSARLFASARRSGRQMGHTPQSAVMCVSLSSAFVLYLAAVCISMDSAFIQVACSHSTSMCAGGSSTNSTDLPSQFDGDLSSQFSGSELTSTTSCITLLQSSILSCSDRRVFTDAPRRQKMQSGQRPLWLATKCG